MTELEQLTEELNDAIATVIARFQDLDLKVSASVNMGAQRDLSFEKVGSEWTLMVHHVGVTQTQPLLKCSRVIRVQAVEHFDALLAALHEASGEMARSVRAAIEKTEAFLVRSYNTPFEPGGKKDA